MVGLAKARPKYTYMCMPLQLAVLSISSRSHAFYTGLAIASRNLYILKYSALMNQHACH